MKKSLKIMLIFIFTLFSFFSINSTSIKASDNEITTEELTTFTYVIDDFSEVFEIWGKGMLKKNSKGVVGFNLSENVKNNMLTGDLEKVVIKYKYCKLGLTTELCLWQSKLKTKTLYSDDELVFPDNNNTDYYPIGKMDDTFFAIPVKNISSATDSLSNAWMNKDDYNKLMTYDYYAVLPKVFVPTSFFVSATYTNVKGVTQTDICPDGGCSFGSNGKVISFTDSVFETIYNFIQWIKDNSYTLLLLVAFFLVGVWIGPLITIITGGVKMILKILDYIWITIVNCFIAIHNVWFWLFTKDDFKRRNKLKPYRRYN